VIATDRSREAIATARLRAGNERLGMFGNFGLCGVAVLLLG
jgi:hypothetical protein